MHAQIFSLEFGARGDEDGEDGFDPYWGVLSEKEPVCEGDLSADAGWLVAQLAPLLGHHAPKCGLIRQLGESAGVSLESVTRPGDTHIPCLAMHTHAMFGCCCHGGLLELHLGGLRGHAANQDHSLPGKHMTSKSWVRAIG